MPEALDIFTGEHLLESLRAEALLAQLDLTEDLAQLHDDEPSLELRRRYADQYRRVIGVPPRRRQILRDGLTSIQATGRATVADLVKRIVDAHSENGVRVGVAATATGDGKDAAAGAC